MAIFPSSFLGNIGQENIFYDMLERKNAFLKCKKKKLKKSKNWNFCCKGVNPWFWSKNGYFSIVFLGNIGEENFFYDILERKNAFLGYQNSKFKIRIIAIFLNWLTHGFGPKINIFLPFF